MSGVSSEEWPQYKEDTQDYLVLDEALVDGAGKTGSGVKPLQCAFFRDYLQDLVTHTGRSISSMLFYAKARPKWSTVEA